MGSDDLKVVFLDVDGVLNTGNYIIEQYNKTGKPHSGHHSEFDPICMKNLKDLVDETDAYIVISSTWRLGNHETDEGWMALMDRLNDYGLKDRVIGCTPDLSRKYNSMCCRGYEIQKWLDDNKDKNIGGFVIIDDDSDMYHLMNKLAKCSFKDGFTFKVKRKALKILGC
jgi:hypothetical protein